MVKKPQHRLQVAEPRKNSTVRRGNGIRGTICKQRQYIEKEIYVFLITNKNELWIRFFLIMRYTYPLLSNERSNEQNEIFWKNYSIHKVIKIMKYYKTVFKR